MINTEKNNMRLNQESVLTWAKNEIKTKGYVIEHPPEIIHDGPWSIVYRISTNTVTLYLKQMVPAFAMEPTLIGFLKPLCPTSLPEIMSQNDNLNCFLMHDAGTPLQTILRVNYQADLAIKGLTVYSTIQQGAANHIDELLALGVPDWRLNALPSLYMALLEKNEFLKLYGLTQTEINSLKHSNPKVIELCHQLAQYHIPEAIDHSDFHDNNILVNEHNDLIVNDWGETVITHPFFSLVNFLFGAARQHKIIEGSKTWSALRDGYLNNWLPFESKDRLLEAYKLAHQLGYIKYALSYYPITQCLGWHESGQNRGRITQALRSFLQLEEQ